MSSQAEKCTKCSKVPDDILMLACNHDLCLPCAAKSFAAQHLQPKRNKKEFTCDVCSHGTELDATSVYELEKLHLTACLNDRSNRKTTSKSHMSSDKQLRGKSTQKENKENQRSVQKLVETRQETKTSLHQSQRNMSKQQSENSFLQAQSRGYCSEHPDEEISYYCFDCNCKCVCPECIIHGIHKNHEVKTIRKAYPTIRKLLDEMVEQNNNGILQIEQNRVELERKEQQQVSVMEKMKVQISQEFQIIHQILHIKEQELLDKVDAIPSVVNQQQTYLEKCNEIEGRLNQWNDKINDVMVMKDEAGLLNYYAGIFGQQVPIIPQLPIIKEVMLNQQQFSTQTNDIKQRCEQLIISDSSLEIRKH